MTAEPRCMPSIMPPFGANGASSASSARSVALHSRLAPRSWDHTASRTRGPGWRPAVPSQTTTRARGAPRRPRGHPRDESPRRGSNPCPRHRAAPARAPHGRSACSASGQPLRPFVSPEERQCPPNTADKLRSGARVQPGRRGHEPAPSSAERCRRKLRQFHPLVRRRPHDAATLHPNPPVLNVPRPPRPLGAPDAFGCATWRTLL